MAPGLTKIQSAEFSESSEGSCIKSTSSSHSEEIVIPGSETTVLVFKSQPGTKFYIANHGPLRLDKPGNGGMRLATYDCEEDAVADCVRLAEGMTRKHGMYRTGFSGAKLVVHADDVDGVDRDRLMQDVAVALESLQGAIYTGCDLNTTDTDMERLSSMSPYVLAGIGSQVDTNYATAASVIGAILGALESMDMSVSTCKFVVQGCGKVGSAVARQLVELSAGHVVTCDLDVERSQVEGCENLLARDENQNKDWRFEACDVFVPCAGSLAIDETAAEALECKFIIGSANSPYANKDVRDTLDARGVFFVPESISSAGAILADSIEWVDQKTFRSVNPDLCYSWVRNVAKEKTMELFQTTKGDAAMVVTMIDEVAHEEIGPPMGCTFKEWMSSNAVF